MTVQSHFFRFATSLAFAGAAAVSIGMARANDKPPAAIEAETKPALACNVPSEITRLNLPLARTAKRLAAGEPITIVALGSSSTAGAGASSPDNSYPRRLEVELKTLYPAIAFKVFNRGVNGEETSDMLARFDRDVAAEKPDLVLWQVGSNSVLRDRPLDAAPSLIKEGLDRLRAIGADAILVDPQFAPKVLAKPHAAEMVRLLEVTAKEANVDLFHRFAVMRHWREVQSIPFETFLSNDELHMNDWSYGCIAKLMAAVIGEAATRATVTATAAGAARPSAR